MRRLGGAADEEPGAGQKHQRESDLSDDEGVAGNEPPAARTFARAERSELSVTAGSLDDPNLIKPTLHIFVQQKCAWLHLDKVLPSFDRYPPGGEDREF